jgi:hypothetical protein
MRPLVRRLLAPLWYLLAALFLMEAWLWDNLAPVVAWIVRRLPFQAFKDAVAAGIARLPPWLTLLVFAIPGLVLLPFKLAGVWLIGTGHVILGFAAFFLAKTVSLAVTAFLFEVCRPKLMEMSWFRRLYALVMRGRAWAHEMLAPFSRRIRAVKRLFLAKVEAWRGRGGAFGRMARRLRARAQRVVRPAEVRTGARPSEKRRRGP